MNRKSSNGGTVMGAIAVAAMALCCLGPILLVTGGLAAVVGFLSTPLVVLAGLGVAGLGVSLFVQRSKAATDRSCCTPTRDADTAPVAVSHPDPTTESVRDSRIP
jgi:hypothetical protein